MTKYDKSIIYKLCCKDTSITNIYVGSTTNFRHRKYQHKSTCNNINSKDYNINVYEFIRYNGGFENWDMIEIEKYNATDKRDLEKRERFYIETYKSTLNSLIPSQTQDELKVKKLMYNTEYRKINKEKIKEYREINKEKIKEYREKNREKMKEYLKQYYQRNKNS